MLLLPVALQHLGIDKVPVQDGFSLSADPSLPAAASLNWTSAVAPHSSILLPIAWRPTAAGSVSRLIVFKLDGKHRLQVKLLGKAVVQYNQPPARHSDQSSRTAGQKGVDAAAKKALSSSTAAASKQAAPSGTASAQPTPRGAPVAARPTSAAAPTRSTAGASQFKAPTRSTSTAGGLKLKQQALQVPQASSKIAAARVPAGSAGSAARPQAAARPSPWQEAATGAGGMAPPATPRGTKGNMQLAPASTPTAGKTPRGAGLIGSGSSSQKTSSSARKTFRFFHTE